MRESFLQMLDKRPMVCDGAMGTMLYAKGISFSHCYDELNSTNPQVVKEIHLAYVKAGAEIIETNTFGANALRLQRYGFADKVFAINRAGAELARKVVDQRADKQSCKAWVAGAGKDLPPKSNGNSV